MLMLVMAFVSWWYGVGWVKEISRIRERLARVADFFSIELLFLTLFSPFRQISAGRVQGSLSVILRAWFDRLVSRLIGAMVRSFIIVVGLLTLLLFSLIGLVRALFWPLAPLLPFIFVVLGVIQWLPQ